MNSVWVICWDYGQAEGWLPPDEFWLTEEEAYAELGRWERAKSSFYHCAEVRELTAGATDGK